VSELLSVIDLSHFIRSEVGRFYVFSVDLPENSENSVVASLGFQKLSFSVCVEIFHRMNLLRHFEVQSI